MNNKYFLNKLTIAALFLFLGANFAAAQKSAVRQEKLLNGMNLLAWNDQTAKKATVKLRIHSGAAFDTLGKEGTMALLADILFPTDAAKEFFTEDLGGSLEVVSNYDYIQINATADNDQDKFLTMLETIANAVTNPQIDRETTAKVLAARIASVRELEKNPSYVADQTIAKRLFGDFPYGRAQSGTAQSLQKIDFADLLLAKQRFLTADNATLAVVSGGVKPELVFRAARRYFGAWTQSDKKVPATFRQPDAPDTKFFLIRTDIDKTSELRFAFRGLARSEKDFYASRILTAVLQNRLKAKDGDKVSFEQKSYLMPGLMIVKFSNWDASSLKFAGENAQLAQNFLDYVQNLLAANVSSEEFQIARDKIAQELNNQDAVDLRLDADTFKFEPVKNVAEIAQTTTLADAQRVLERLRREAVVRTYLYKSSV